MTMETDMPRLAPKPAPNTELGKWLRRSGYTGAELARAINVDKATISRVANGGSCSDDLKARIKAATGLRKL